MNHKFVILFNQWHLVMDIWDCISDNICLPLFSFLCLRLPSCWKRANLVGSPVGRGQLHLQGAPPPPLPPPPILKAGLLVLLTWALLCPGVISPRNEECPTPPPSPSWFPNSADTYFFGSIFPGARQAQISSSLMTDSPERPFRCWDNIFFSVLRSKSLVLNSR